MEFRFNTNKQYFTVEEQRGFDDFLALGINEGLYYTNHKGETILTGRIDYPAELIIPGDTHYGRELENGGHMYCTPKGNLYGSKSIKISYVQDDKWKLFTHLEFIKWLDGKPFEVADHERPEQPDFIKGRLEIAKSQSTQKVESAEEVEEEAKAWNPQGKTMTDKKSKKKDK